MLVKEIEIVRIKRKRNSRSTVNKDAMASLMNSIKSNGLLQPVGVTPHGDTFHIVYGHRRVEACYKLGFKKIHAIILDVSTQEEMLDNLVENIQRVDVSSYDIGGYVSTLMNEFDMSESEVAARLSIPKGRVRQSLSIFKDTPKKYISKVKTMSFGEPSARNGNIPSVLASRIIGMTRKFNLSKVQIEKLFSAASKDNSLTCENIQVLMALMNQGISLKDSLKKLSTISVLRPSIVMHKKDVDDLKNKFGSIHDGLHELLYNSRKMKVRDPRK